MALYIKANPLVAKFLGLETQRIKSPDGNYILWQADMLAFGPLFQIHETAKRIGAVLMSPGVARQEQDGEICHEMPVAEDPRFIIQAPEEPQEEPQEQQELPEPSEEEEGEDMTEPTEEEPQEGAQDVDR